MLREGDLLVVAEGLYLALGQAELAVWDGGGWGGHCSEPCTATALSSAHWRPRAMDAGVETKDGGKARERKHGGAADYGGIEVSKAVVRWVLERRAPPGRRPGL